MNLLINAHDALIEEKVESPYIHIRAREREDGAVCIYVSNNGPQIPADNLGKIFQRKFTTKQNHGSGIGLFISQRLARKNAGKLQAQSSRNETVFILELPLPGVRPSLAANDS